jgi:hypothetical protein
MCPLSRCSDRWLCARTLPGCRAHVLRGGSYDTYARSARVSLRGRPTTEFNMDGAFGLRAARLVDGERT